MTDIRIVAGDPTPEELAAVIAVLYAARGTDAAATPEPARPAWRDSARPTVPLRAGPGSWRASGQPTI